MEDLKLILYTSPSQPYQNDNMRQYLQRHGYPYSESARVVELQSRLGHQLLLPGVLVDETLYIPYTNKEVLLEYVLDNLLAPSSSPFKHQLPAAPPAHMWLPTGVLIQSVQLAKDLREILPKRPFHGGKLLSILQEHYKVDKQTSLSFGSQLLQENIVVKVREATCFHTSKLTLHQNLFPHALNSLLKSHDKLSPLKCVVGLSKLQTLQELDEKSCTCQNVEISDNTNVALYLNLYCAMVRHLHLRFQPSTHAQQEKLYAQYGYIIGGRFVKISQVRQLLLGQSHSSKLHRSGRYYTKRQIQTDVRFVFVRNTIFPESSLEQQLQNAAVEYCQSIAIRFDSVVELPYLLSLYRMDFGGRTAQEVLSNIRSFLSVDQIQAIQDLHRAGLLSVRFADFKTPSLTTSTQSKNRKEITFEPLPQDGIPKNISLDTVGSLPKFNGRHPRSASMGGHRQPSVGDAEVYSSRPRRASMTETTEDDTTTTLPDITILQPEVSGVTLGSAFLGMP